DAPEVVEVLLEDVLVGVAVERADGAHHLRREARPRLPRDLQRERLGGVAGHRAGDEEVDGERHPGGDEIEAAAFREEAATSSSWGGEGVVRRGVLALDWVDSTRSGS